jgi:hypothetical protein
VCGAVHWPHARGLCGRRHVVQNSPVPLIARNRVNAREQPPSVVSGIPVTHARPSALRDSVSAGPGPNARPLGGVRSSRRLETALRWW